MHAVFAVVLLGDSVMARMWWLLASAIALYSLSGSPGGRPEGGCATAAEPADRLQADLILHHGKIVTVDKHFAIREALAVQGGRILRVGSNDEILQTKGPQTKLLDLQGKTVLPGLIDSHVHPTGACLTEYDHPIPEMESIQDVLDYVRARAKVLAAGEWITVDQVFITRLREQRYPTKDELDRAAPNNPVVFRTGPDAALNSLALKLSKIDKDFQVTDLGAGYAEKDPKTGEPTGILRNCTRYVRSQSTGRQPTDLDRMERLLALFKDYNSVGLTSIVDRDASVSAIEQYRQLHDKDRLPLRIAVSQHIDTSGDIDQVRKRIRQVAENPLCKGAPSPRPLPRGERGRGEGDPMLRIVGIKTYLDGGMLTGSAYMRQPWGVSKIYSITDPDYRGLLFIPRERLEPIVQT